MFVDGTQFVSVEVDALGRPARFATPDVVVELSSDTETGVTVETLRVSDAEVVREEVSFTPEELDELRVTPIDLSLVDKAQTSSILGVRLDELQRDLLRMAEIASSFASPSRPGWRRPRCDTIQSWTLPGAC